jgi:hypothetical protein
MMHTSLKLLTYRPYNVCMEKIQDALGSSLAARKGCLDILSKCVAFAHPLLVQTEFRKLSAHLPQ